MVCWSGCKMPASYIRCCATLHTHIGQVLASPFGAHRLRKYHVWLLHMHTSTMVFGPFSRRIVISPLLAISKERQSTARVHSCKLECQWSMKGKHCVSLYETPLTRSISHCWSHVSAQYLSGTDYSQGDRSRFATPALSTLGLSRASKPDQLLPSAHAEPQSSRDCISPLEVL